MLILALLLSACSSQSVALQHLMTFNKGEFLLKNQPQPPADESAWHAVSLPDLWDAQRPLANGAGWYRFHFTLDKPPGQLWGIYLPRINRNVAVFINGTLIGQDAPFDASRVNSWNHPQYFNIANGLLHSGENTVMVRLIAEPKSRGRLLPFYMGPDAQLRPIYQRAYFTRITLAQMVGAFALTMGLCIGIIWLIRREAEYGWFTLGSLFWAAYTLWYFVQHIPINNHLWIMLTNISGMWMIGSMWIFVGLHAGLDIKNTKRSIIAYCSLVSIILPLLPHLLQFDAMVIAYLLLFIPNGWMLWLFVRNWQNKPTLDNGMIFVSILPIVLLGTHDWLNLAFHLQHNYLMHYAAPFIFLLMGWALLRRFIQAIHESEILNRELERRVAERETELQQAFDTIHQMEKKKALEQERERIMRDIHDGVGGQLVSALAILEHDRRQNPLLTESLNFALDDLRLVIDTLAPDDASLDEQLGMFKYRYEPRLHQYGISLQWQQTRTQALPDFSPQQTLQLLRIIQEIFTNILKHANARKIKLVIGYNEEQQFYLQISDDGDGFTPGQKIRGRGIGNMRRRAQEIGMEITFYNLDTGGACVNLRRVSE